MKILFIAPKFSGGIGGHAARVAEKLQEHGFEIKLIEYLVFSTSTNKFSFLSCSLV